MTGKQEKPWTGWFVKLANEFSGGAAAGIIDAALASGLMLPPGDFFGSGYKFAETSVPVECEGFDYTVRFEPDKTVHGLIPGSNAEKAGLRNGDKIIKPYNGQRCSRLRFAALPL